MVDVMIVISGKDSVLGPIELDQLPRVGETVNLPGPQGDEGFRSFDVIQVSHFAAGGESESEMFLKRAISVLTCTEND